MDFSIIFIISLAIVNSLPAYIKPNKNYSDTFLVKIPHDTYKTPGYSYRDLSYKTSDNKIQEDEKQNDLRTSSSLVYRPLFVYRRIVHNKRRISMYNAFAG